jgi:hypothetical protein
MVFDYVEKHSFVTVLLLASVPNPLFDLAGLTCGHLLIPFWTFFIATGIGKSIIKVNLQVFFIVFAFSAPQINYFLEKLRQVGAGFVSEQITKMIDKQKRLLITQEDVKEDTMIGQIWNCFLTLMILYFFCSIIDGIVKEEWTNQKIKSKKQQKIK